MIAQGVRNKNTCTNLIHNPKYHLYRWFSYFGGGLSKKPNSELIAVSSYKNNGEVSVQPDTNIISHAISSVETLQEPISLGRLRLNNRVYFSGENITVTLMQVDFEEFYNLYHRWRYGRDLFTGKSCPSRGYIDVKINNEIISIYPLGSNAFEYERAFRELTIRGKIKAK